MTQTADEAPWPITFSRQDLLTACWGSKKGADLLYHLLHKVKWEIKNQKLPTSVKVIKFQEKRQKLFEAIEKGSGAPISQGSYNTLLRCFNDVGYTVTSPYSHTFEVHLDVIERAFSNPPQRPLKEGEEPKQPRQKSVNASKRQIDTVTREEYNLLSQACVNLTEMCQSLTQKVAELTEMCQSLTLANRREAAPQEVSRPFSEGRYDLEKEDHDLDSFFGSADAPAKEEVFSCSHISKETTPVGTSETPVPWVSGFSAFLQETDTRLSDFERMWLQEKPVQGEKTPEPARPAVVLLTNLPGQETLFPELKPVYIETPFEWQQARESEIATLKDSWDKMPRASRGKWKDYKEAGLKSWDTSHPAPEQKVKPKVISDLLIQFRGWKPEEPRFWKDHWNALDGWCYLHTEEEAKQILGYLKNPSETDKWWKENLSNLTTDAFVKHTPKWLAEIRKKTLTVVSGSDGQKVSSPQKSVSGLPKFTADGFKVTKVLRPDDFRTKIAVTH